MSHPTTPPDANATTVTATVQLDVTAFAERIATLVVRGLVAHAAADDIEPASPDDRNDPDLDRFAVTIAEHGPGEHRTRTRLTPGGVYEIHCSCGEYDATAATSAAAELAAGEHRSHPGIS